MSERIIDVGTDVYRRPPSTQNGETQDTGATHTQERPVGEQFPADPVNLAPAPDQRPSPTPINPPDASFGPGSLGSDVEGWHPGRD